MAGPSGPYALGPSGWNDQGSSPGHSSNTPAQQLWDATGTVAPQAPAPFWDTWVNASGLEVTADSMSPWDVVLIGREALPGRCSVDVKQTRRVKPNIVAQRDYATLVYKGLDPADITITCAIWTSSQFDRLCSMMEMLKRPARDVANPTSVIQAIDIAHPSLQVLGITQVLIDSLTGLREAGAKGVREMKIHALEYNKSTKPGGGTVNGATLSKGLISGKGARLPLPSGDDSFLAPLVPFKP